MVDPTVWGLGVVRLPHPQMATGITTFSFDGEK